MKWIGTPSTFSMYSTYFFAFSGSSSKDRTLRLTRLPLAHPEISSFQPGSSS